MKRKLLMSMMLFSALAMFGSTIYAATFLDYGYKLHHSDPHL